MNRANNLKYLAAIFISILLTANTHADTIILKSGARLEGTIEKNTGGTPCQTCNGQKTIKCPQNCAHNTSCTSCRGVGKIKCPQCEGRGYTGRTCHIKLKSGMRFSIPEKEILRIEISTLPPEELLPPKDGYKLLKSKLKNGDYKAELNLANWAYKKRLFNEAHSHATHIINNSPSLKPNAEIIIEQIIKRYDSQAQQLFRTLQKQLKKDKYDQALGTLLRLKKLPYSKLITDGATTYIAKKHPWLKNNLGPNIFKIKNSIELHIDCTCAKCKGIYKSKCEACKGLGFDACNVCGGRGSYKCLICNGRGTHKCEDCPTSRILPNGQIISSSCRYCRNTRRVKCKTCTRGSQTCIECSGKKISSNKCNKCSGTGNTNCAECQGSGVKLFPTEGLGVVEILAEAPPIKTHNANSQNEYIFQGVSRGRIITALNAKTIYSSSPNLLLKNITKKHHTLLAISIDNRDSTKPIAPPLKIIAHLKTGEQTPFIPPPQIPELNLIEQDATAQNITHLMQIITPTHPAPGEVKSFVIIFPATVEFKNITYISFGSKNTETDIIILKKCSPPPNLP